MENLVYYTILSRINVSCYGNLEDCIDGMTSLAIITFSHNEYLFISSNAKILSWYLVKEDSSHTIGVEFGSRVVNVGGKTIKLQIWDTGRISRLNFFQYLTLYLTKNI